MSQTIYTVAGMSCAHCAGAVSGELRALAGVRDVQVDVSTGRVTVTSDEPLPEPVVRAAVEEAGYQLVAG
jgi:copper chaperone